MKNWKIIVLAVVLFPLSSLAHPGRTDSSGGHTCRTNCSKWGLGQGEYHYHGGGRSKSKPKPKKPPKPKTCPKEDLSGVTHVKLKKTSNIRSGPGTNYGKLATLKAEKIVKKIEVKDDWVKIEFGKKKVGWVYRCLVMGHKV